MGLEIYWILNSKRYIEKILSYIDNSSLLPIFDTRDRAKENKDWERAWNEESSLWAAAVCGPWVRGKETAEEVRIGRAWLVLAQDHPHHILSSSSFIGSSCTSWHQGKYSYSIIVSFSTLGLVHHRFFKIEWYHNSRTKVFPEKLFLYLSRNLSRIDSLLNNKTSPWIKHCLLCILFFFHNR